jgi:DNA repair exonuclease SbcCD ATPase subunit
VRSVKESEWMARERADVEKEVEGLRAEFEALQNRAAEYAESLEELGRQQSEAAGRLELARRQAQEYRALLEARESELAEARRQEAAYEAFRAAVASRDAVGLEAAAAIDAALDALREYARLEAVLPTVEKGVAGSYDFTVPGEPEPLQAAWERLVAAARTRIVERLDDEIVDAAARSLAGHDIDKLPEHLQVLARERRQQFFASQRERTRARH